MRFTYTYRSSDGQRHAAEIEAESRDAAFEAIRRELGVKPIKVIAAEGAEGLLNGRGAAPNHKGIALLVAGLALLAAGLGIWWWAAWRSDAPYQVMTPQGPVTYTVAMPLPRQTIPGDRARIEAARETSFQTSAERFLSRFAEPGRKVENVEFGKYGNEDPARPARSARLKIPIPTEAEFRAALREPGRIASTDFTEVVDLKRIVAGMKREMRAYLAGGGTAEQYLAELVKRQRLEISYRERAEHKLNEMLSDQHPLPEKSNNPTNNDNLRAAYAYWLKANATLKSMGIYELPLPDALHGYQAALDLAE